MTSLPRFYTKYGANIGIELFFEFPEIMDDVNPKAYLDADSASGVSALSADGTDFAISQYIIIGQPGNEKSEIVQVHASTSPTSTTITLVAATSFPHNRGDVLRFIPYNQITPERSVNGGTSFSTLSALNIRADATETYLQRTADASTDVYRYRFSNSTSALFSAYSDNLTASGYADNTIWSIKQRALRQVGEKTSDLITDQDLNDWIQEARRWADQDPAVLRWSFRTKFGQVIGQMLAGQWSIAAPTTLRDPNTYKNILSLRMANQNRPLVYQDRVRFNQNYLNVVHTTVASAYTHGSTSLVLTSTHDLDSSGAISVANNSVADGLISIAYSANNKSTNTLTITATAARDISAATDVWQRAVFGLPTAYTIDNGTLYFDVPLKVDYDGQDMKGDWYRTVPTIDTDADLFDEPFYDLYVSYLKFKIKYKKANGRIDRDGDVDWKDWVTGLSNLIGQEVPGQRINFVPDIEGFLSSTE